MLTTKEKVAMNLCYLIQDDYTFANEIILEYLGLVDNNRLNDLLEFTNNEMRANVQSLYHYYRVLQPLDFPTQSCYDQYMSWETNSNSSLLHLIMTLSTEDVVIHCDPRIAEVINNLPMKSSYNGDEIDIFVNDIPYEVQDGIYHDPDELLCEHYNIPYDLVNCIEAI